MASKPAVGLMVAEETEHGVTRVVARPVLLTETGELRHPQFDVGHRPVEGLADLEIYTFVDQDAVEWRTYGLLCEYAPRRVDVRRAEVMARTLRRIRKGLDRADSEQGYLPNDTAGWAGYLFRIAAILGVHSYYLATSGREQELTAQPHRRTDGAGVQSWLSTLAYQHDKARNRST
jgi:hypothetical protein